MARSKERIKPFLEWIEKEWNKQPDLRFTQLCVSLNIVPNTPGGWFYQEEYNLPENFEDVRKFLTWGTYGKGGKTKLKVAYLKDMDKDHIEACLKTQETMSEYYREYFELELEYRRRKKKNANSLDK